MKRPHRSIETFDISLMAVVTKAMGAFLVLMLLLIPYYKSGPIAQKPIDDLAKKVEEVNKNIKDVVDKLTTASAEDLRKLLDEALKELEEARKLIAELQRAIDQLNAQVKRLEDEKAALVAQVDQLEKDKAALAAQVAELQKQIEPLKAQIAELQKENDELKKEIEPLKAQIAELQNESNTLKAKLADLERQIDPLKAQIAQLQPQNSALKAENQVLQAKLAQLTGNFAMGELTNLGCDVGMRVGLYPKNGTITLPDKSVSKYILNTGGEGQSGVSAKGSFFISRGLSPGRYALVAAGTEGRKLKSPASDCKAILTLQWGLRPDALIMGDPGQIQIQKGSYATLLTDIVVSDQDIDQVAPSAESRTWLEDQIGHAEKEP
jgi:peptidoglycan hydrolase CwlO-like protein